MLCWRTRGQVAVDVTGQRLPPIVAKANISPPDDAIADAYDWWDEDVFGKLPTPAEFRALVQSMWMVDLFLNRTAGEKIPQSWLTPLREMVEEDADLIEQEGEKTLNMEFDWKRDLVQPHVMQAFTDRFPAHFAARSRPWSTLPDFERERKGFDQWRKKRAGVLKTMADWDAWIEYRKTGNASKMGVKRNAAGIIGQVKRNFLRAFTRGMWGLPGNDYNGTAAYLTEHGYGTTVDDCKNAKRSKKGPIEHAIPMDAEVMKFIDAMLAKFSGFEWRKMISDQPDAISGETAIAN